MTGRASGSRAAPTRDQAHNDFARHHRRVRDRHRRRPDGFSSAVDCNDTVAEHPPRRARGVRQRHRRELRRARQPDLDRDADGFPQPGDCDDANAGDPPQCPRDRAATRSTRTATGRADPFAELAALVSNQWAVARTFARLRSLVVHNAPTGARIVLTLRGRGCPFERAAQTVPRELSEDRAPSRLPPRAAAAGTRLRLTITAAGDYRADVHLRRQARRAARGRTCAARRAKRGRSLLRRRLLACRLRGALRFAPATALLPGPSTVRRRPRPSFTDDAGDGPDHGVRHRGQHPLHPLQRRWPRPREELPPQPERPERRLPEGRSVSSVASSWQRQ